MEPVTINLPDHKAGDSWEGLTIGPVLFVEDGQSYVPPAALASCRLYFRYGNPQKTLGYRFKSAAEEGCGTIEINDPAAWYVIIPPQALPLKAGNYEWDFETTDADGIVRTIYDGILKVTQDVSHD